MPTSSKTGFSSSEMLAANSGEIYAIKLKQINRSIPEIIINNSELLLFVAKDDSLFEFSFGDLFITYSDYMISV